MRRYRYLETETRVFSWFGRHLPWAFARHLAHSLSPLSLMGKFKIFIICGILVILVVMPELIIESLHMVWELLLEALHVLFEMLEMSLDTVIEHTFETGLHETQIIVFYIIMLFVFYGLLRLWRVMPRYLAWAKEGYESVKADCRTYTVDFWGTLSLLQKTGYILGGLLFLYLLSFFLM